MSTRSESLRTDDDDNNNNNINSVLDSVFFGKKKKTSLYIVTRITRLVLVDTDPRFACTRNGERLNVVFFFESPYRFRYVIVISVINDF